MQLLTDFHWLRDEACDLQHLVNTHREMFEAGEAVDKILQNSAHAFFGDLNNWMWELFILRVSRLTDPKKTGGKSNLTVGHLIDQLQSHRLSTVSIDSLGAEISSYRKKFIEAPRNKVVVHADLEQARDTAILGAHNQNELDDFLQLLQCFFDEVGEAIGEGPLDYQSQPGPGDVVDLIRLLRQFTSPQTDECFEVSST